MSWTEKRMKEKNKELELEKSSQVSKAGHEGTYIITTLRVSET
jgi:hypothetical protein